MSGPASTLAFDCPTCGRPPTAAGRPGWAEAAAWVDSVAWSPAPGEPWALRDRAPTPGEAVSLRVRHPFRATRGVPLRVIHQPALAALNGWLEHPEALLGSSIVTLRPERWQMLDGGARVEATVLAAARFADLSADVDGPPTAGLQLPVHPPGTAERLEIGDLTYIEGSAQGDVGGWVLMAGDVVWLYGQWGPHLDAAFVGPARLSPADRRALDAACGRAG